VASAEGWVCDVNVAFHTTVKVWRLACDLLFVGVWKRVNAFPPEPVAAKHKLPESPDCSIVTAAFRAVG
jgi:hypothetical protein